MTREIIRIKDKKHWKSLQRSKKWQCFGHVESDYFPGYASKDDPVVILNAASICAFANAALKAGDIELRGHDLKPEEPSDD